MEGKQRWIDAEKFLDRINRDLNIFYCSYSPEKGPNVNNFCSSRAIYYIKTGNYTKYRCEKCKNGKGVGQTILENKSLEIYGRALCPPKYEEILPSFELEPPAYESDNDYKEILHNNREIVPS